MRIWHLMAIVALVSIAPLGLGPGVLVGLFLALTQPYRPPHPESPT